ncbi:hypothetical protein GQ44DRAFT_725083 [Phaeosphaeriaceae sp. PMI808]|nr:hypothetical protein GQ44DRAFT_725083 [Phaeosphaeriaceae sp. PMI808]
MGRPKKRRREEGAEQDVMLLTDLDVNGVVTNDPPTIIESEFGIVTPPQLHDQHFSPDGVMSKDGMPSHHFTGLDSFNVSRMANNDFDPEFQIDPSLWDTPATLNPQLDGSPRDFLAGPCTCLSIMYLSLSELQSIQSFAFPQVVIPLRKAMGVLSDLIHCPQCPNELFSAIQNIQSIVSLCKAIIERIHKALLEINAEAERLELSGVKKHYRIGDNNPETHHFHTGTLDCPMGFNIDITAEDWRRLAKTALKSEVFGNGSNQRPLLQLVKEAEERQLRWHAEKEYCSIEAQQLVGRQHPDEAKKRCEALGADHIRRMIDALKWE